MADYYIERGAVGGNGTSALPWGTFAELVAGTPNGDLGGSIIYVGGDGTGLPIDGQFVVGLRIGFRIAQWVGKPAAKMDFSTCPANQATIFKTAGWAGEITIDDVDVTCSSLAPADECAAMRFEGINSASANIAINCTTHHATLGIRVINPSAGELHIDGEHHTAVYHNVAVENPSGTFELYVDGVLRDAVTYHGITIVGGTGATTNINAEIYGNARNGLNYTTDNAGVLNVLPGCRCHHNLWNGASISSNSGTFTASVDGEFDNNTGHGITCDTNSGGGIEIEDTVVAHHNGFQNINFGTTSGGVHKIGGTVHTASQMGIRILTTGGAATLIWIHRLLSHTNQWDGIRIDSAATGTILITSSLSRGNGLDHGAIYAGLAMANTAVGCKVYRVTCSYNDQTGLSLNGNTEINNDIRGCILSHNGVAALGANREEDLWVSSGIINHVTLTLLNNNLYKAANRMVAYRGVTYTYAQFPAFMAAAEGTMSNQVTGATGPELDAFPNARQAMEFVAGVNEAMALRNLTYPGNRPGAGAFRIFVVFTNTGTNDSTLFTNMTDDATGGGTIVQLNRTAINELRPIIWDNGVLSGFLSVVGTAFNNGSPHVLMFGRMIGTGALGVDQLIVKLDNAHIAGSPFDLPAGFASINNPGTTNAVTGWWILGAAAAAPTSGQRYLGPARMGEVLCYKADLALADEKKIYDYLAKGWGV